MIARTLIFSLLVMFDCEAMLSSLSRVGSIGLGSNFGSVAIARSFSVAASQAKTENQISKNVVFDMKSFAKSEPKNNTKFEISKKTQTSTSSKRIASLRNYGRRVARGLDDIFGMYQDIMTSNPLLSVVVPIFEARTCPKVFVFHTFFSLATFLYCDYYEKITGSSYYYRKWERLMKNTSTAL